MDKERRFGGITRLYGNKAAENFSSAQICVLGIGGVGSWAVEAFARSGVGHLMLMDMDHVAESNINRQLPALESTLGQSKIAVMADRIREINPECSIQPVDDFLSLENIEEWITGDYAWVVDCIDSSRIKAALISHCRRYKIKIITAGGAGGKRDPGQIRVSDLSRTEHDPLLSKTRRLLRQNHQFTSNPKRRFAIPAVWSSEQPIRLEQIDQTQASHLNCGGLGSSMPVTAGFGLAAVAYVLERLSTGN